MVYLALDRVNRIIMQIFIKVDLAILNAVGTDIHTEDYTSVLRYNIVFKAVLHIYWRVGTMWKHIYLPRLKDNSSSNVSVIDLSTL